MKFPRFAAALLPVFAFTLTQPCSAQTMALLNAPLPAAPVSSSALPSNAAFASGYMPVERAPQAPKDLKPKLKIMDWSLIGAAGMLRVLDYTSTERALADPQHFHEAMLPTALVENKPAFAAFQAATVGVNYLAYRTLVHHHMRSLARVGQYLYVSGMAFQVVHNYQALGSVPATSQP